MFHYPTDSGNNAFVLYKLRCLGVVQERQSEFVDNSAFDTTVPAALKTMNNYEVK